MELFRGDCLEVMQSLPDNSVDAIITDPPYGITNNKWDKVVDFSAIWQAFNRLAPARPHVLFALSGFMVDLINSNRKNWRHTWIWYKHRPVGFLSAKKAPLRVHENILVFCTKSPFYNPQKTPGKKYTKTRNHQTSIYRSSRQIVTTTSATRYPTTILDFPAVNCGEHPTQKPLALMEYLIKTYTLPGQTVLDPFMGSGTTGVACKKLGRKFIGIEFNEQYFAVAKTRIENTQEPLLIEEN